HGQVGWYRDAPLALAAPAGIGDNHTPAATGWTGLLDTEKALPLNHDPLATTAPAGCRLCAGACAAAPALRAGFFRRDLEGLLRPGVCFCQVDLARRLQVPARLRPPSAPAAEHAAEQIAKDVHDRLGRAEVGHTHPFEARVAVAVVPLPL